MRTYVHREVFYHIWAVYQCVELQITLFANAVNFQLHSCVFLLKVYVDLKYRKNTVAQKAQNKQKRKRK